MVDFTLCSNCFRDQGLKLDAEHFGEADDSVCPNCKATTGRKLSKDAIAALAHRFFVWGTVLRCDYGVAPPSSMLIKPLVLGRHLGSSLTCG
jgi:hypothetical protein